MHGMATNVRAHYNGDGGSNVADGVRALLETLGPGLVSPQPLAALGHFHVRGADATDEMAKLAGVPGRLDGTGRRLRPWYSVTPLG